MIYFIEVNTEGSIIHCSCDPLITIVPITNRISFVKKAETDKDPQLEPPIEIDEPTFYTLMDKGIANFVYNSSTHTLEEKKS